MAKNKEALVRAQAPTTSSETIRDRAVNAVAALQRASVERGLDTLGDDEIAAQIAAVRAERSR
ncbi:MAG: hypothetical protein AAGU73_08760 [Actinomycetota bacterium]